TAPAAAVPIPLPLPPGPTFAPLLEPRADKISSIRTTLPICIALGRAKAFVAEVSIGEKTTPVRSVQIAVGNGVYYGGGMAVYDAAGIDDQCLDFYSLEPQHLWRLPFILSASRGGRTRALPGVRAFCSGRPLEIRTRPALPVNTDGEITTATPARFQLLPRALTVFAPRNEPRRTHGSLEVELAPRYDAAPAPFWPVPRVGPRVPWRCLPAGAHLVAALNVPRQGRSLSEHRRHYS
ncbi:hypothetical protein N3929_26555, partial [Bosea sp. SSUT22]|nr:hypothetical protein [Bosea spartocytisi]